MQSLAVQEIHDDVALVWLITQLEATPFTDLTIQDSENSSLGNYLFVYTIYSGTTQLATLYVSPIGHHYFIMRVYPYRLDF